MTKGTIKRATFAIALSVGILGVGAGSSYAQDSLGSSVTFGGGTSGVGGGSSVTIAPGVTISGGDVSNSTGIDVLVGGGSSIGATTGGDDSAAVVE